MANRIVAVQVSDTTKADSSNEDDNKKNICSECCSYTFNAKYKSTGFKTLV